MTIPTEPIWIDNAEELNRLCKSWRQQAAIAVDTEFMRSDTFYPIVGLLQIGDGKGCYLIDPLAITQTDELRELLLDTQVVKVLHSCSEDIEVFQRWLGIVPTPVFDTQIAAAFAGLGFGLGYANLVNKLLTIEIPKQETRSDWLQRPLSLAQLKYAALDVAHMLIVYGKLLQLLKENNRLEWVKEDCAELIVKAQLMTQIKTPNDFNNAYEKIAFAWKLRPQELAVLQQLCIWREMQARERNLPRNRVIKEPVIWEIARRKTTDFQQLQKVPDISARTLQQDSKEILQLVTGALASDETTWPSPTDAPLEPAQGVLLKQLKNAVRDLAEKQNIPAELLVIKKDYEFLIRSGLKTGQYQLPKRLIGWRYSVVGQHLLNIVSNQHYENNQ
jgi:ribonuclease D